MASGAYRGESLVPDGFRPLIEPTEGTCATLAQVSRYDPVPGPRLARPELQYGSLLCPVDEPSLFSETTLTREWGRISWPDQTRIALYEIHTVDMEALETWLQRKSRRGYVLRERMERRSASAGAREAVVARAKRTVCRTKATRTNASELALRRLSIEFFPSSAPKAIMRSDLQGSNGFLELLGGPESDLL